MYHKHNFSKFNEESLLNDFENLDLAFLNDSYLDINAKFNRLLSILDTLVETHAPLKKLSKKREVIFKSKPWNAKIQNTKMMCIRDKLLRKLKRNSNHTLKDLYKQFRNRVSNYLRESKASYFYNYLHRKSNNMKNLWSGIKSVTILDNQTIPIL